MTNTDTWASDFAVEQQALGLSNEAQINSGIRWLRGLDRPVGRGRPDLAHWLAGLEWLRIQRVGYSAGEAAHRQQTAAPLTGLSHLGRTCAYLLAGDGEAVTCYWGMASSIHPLQAALSAAWPEVIADSLGPRLDGEARRLTAGLAYSGVPAWPREDQLAGAGMGWSAVDALLQSARGMVDPWLWLLVFRPAQPQMIAEWYAQIASLIKEVRIRFLQPNTPSAFSRTAKSYEDLLEEHLALMERGLAEGGWLTYGLALTTPQSMQYLHAALTATFGGEQSRPELWHLRPAGAQVDHIDWRGQLTFLPSGRLASMADLPRREHPGLEVGTMASFDLVPPTRDQVHVASTPRLIPLGHILDGQRPMQQQLAIELDALSSHLFVAGITGSGKTSTIRTLLLSAAAHGVRVLVIEPVKREYRHLGLPNLRVFSLGEPGCQLRLNPFAFEGVTCSTHLDHLKALFAAAYVLYPPMPYVLEQALHEVYLDRGWDLVSGLCWRALEGHSRAWPTLTDLYAKVGEVIARSGYGPRLEPEIRAALKVRINNLRLGAKGTLLDTRASATLDDLIAHPTVLELQGIGDAEQRAFLLGMILTRIYEGCIAWGPSDKLRLIVVLEEAHRLLEEKHGAGSEDFANPQARAIQSFADMLAEMRSYGVGLVVAEQSPSRITRQVMKNTATKIAHQLVDAEEWQLMAGGMALTEDEGRSLATLPRGQALVFTPRMDRPMRVQVEPAATSQLALPAPDIEPAQVQLGVLQRIMAEDARVRAACHRLIVTWLLEEMARAEESWADFVQTIRAAAPTVISSQPLERELAALVASQILDGVASQAGRLFGWPFDIEVEGARHLDLAIQETAQRGVTPSVMEALRAWWLPKLEAERPFAGCRDCPHPCRYRLFILLDQGNQPVAGMRDLLRASQPDWEQIALTMDDRLQRLTSEDAESRLPLARCLATHQVQLAGFPNRQQAAIVARIVADLEDPV